MIIPKILDEIEEKITEIKTDDIFPTNAPEEHNKPYLVYTRTSLNIVKTLKGMTDKQSVGIMFSVMATKYKDMVLVRDKIVELLRTFPTSKIGVNKDFYIEDLTINNITETWESSLNVNRGIIDFTVYY